MAGRIRHLRQDAKTKMVAVGIELVIDPSAKPNEIRSIQNYVMQRQLEIRRLNKK